MTAPDDPPLLLDGHRPPTAPPPATAPTAPVQHAAGAQPYHRADHRPQTLTGRCGAPAVPLVAVSDLVAWRHGDEVQVGAVQNVGEDGRVWLHRLDRPRTAIPQPVAGLVLLARHATLVAAGHLELGARP